MMQESLLQNNFLLTNSILLFVAFFIGCSGGTNGSSAVSSTKESVYSYAVLGPISNANVRILRVVDAKLAYETQTKTYNNELEVTWPQNKIGSFVVDTNNSFSDDDLMLIHVTSGSDVDANDDGQIDASFTTLQGDMYAYATLRYIKESGVYVNIFSTLAAQKVTAGKSPTEIIDILTLYAKKIFRLSLNSDDEIDYKDLNAFVPNLTETKKFINPEIYTQMQSSGLMFAVLDDENLSEFINRDSDGDGLTWEEEIFIGSSVSLVDTDADGLLDFDELQAGTDPLNKDSDFDGINDADEIQSGTNPLNSDMDGDYIPDGVELARGSNPFNGDEDLNGILDGLDGDPFFKYQWHLRSEGTVVSNTNNIATIIGNDLDILEVYHYQLGNGSSTIIQVVDTGVELIHEDLPIDLTRSLNAVTGGNDPTSTQPVSKTDPYSPFGVGHGTAVAGIIAARANNGTGVRGVVPNAVIAGSNWLEEQSLYELERAWYSAPNADEILVSNNSWGTYFLKDTSFEDIIKLSVEQLRGGKGRVFTVAAGNDRKTFGNANLSYVANNRYSIAVASLDYNNTFSSYSNPGSNILVSGYGGERYYESPTIATTLLTGKSYYEAELGTTRGAITFDEDSEKSYTFSMNGTSSATPMVSGAIALVLESCPNLTWRDVRWLLSYTSRRIDENNEKWIKNSAGRIHNINYGYGLVDADAMIQECRSKYYENLSVEKSGVVSINNLNTDIPDTKIGVQLTIDFLDAFVVEWVELTFDSDHPYAGDLEIVLVSPSGTRTQIITPNELRSNTYSGGFRFSSAAFMGENSNGRWTIEVIDQLESDSGKINSVQLKMYGH